MPKPLTDFLRGLTTQHIGVLWIVLGGAFWLGEIKPRIQAAEEAHRGMKHEVSRIADSVEGFRREVADIKTEVKVQGVLIAQMEDLKGDISELRRDMSGLASKMTLGIKSPP
jgi:hypothetical protein